MPTNKYINIVWLLLICSLGSCNAAWQPDQNVNATTIDDGKPEDKGVVVVVGDVGVGKSTLIAALLTDLGGVSAKDDNMSHIKLENENAKDLSKIRPKEKRRETTESNSYTLKDGTEIIDTRGFGVAPNSRETDQRSAATELHQILTTRKIQGILIVVESRKEFPSWIMDFFASEEAIGKYASASIGIAITIPCTNSDKSDDTCYVKFASQTAKAYRYSFYHKTILNLFHNVKDVSKSGIDKDNINKKKVIPFRRDNKESITKVGELIKSFKGISKEAFREDIRNQQVYTQFFDNNTHNEWMVDGSDQHQNDSSDRDRQDVILDNQETIVVIGSTGVNTSSLVSVIKEGGLHDIQILEAQKIPLVGDINYKKAEVGLNNLHAILLKNQIKGIMLMVEPSELADTSCENPIILDTIADFFINSEHLFDHEIESIGIVVPCKSENSEGRAKCYRGLANRIKKAYEDNNKHTIPLFDSFHTLEKGKGKDVTSEDINKKRIIFFDDTDEESINNVCQMAKILKYLPTKVFKKSVDDIYAYSDALRKSGKGQGYNNLVHKILRSLAVVLIVAVVFYKLYKENKDRSTSAKGRSTSAKDRPTSAKDRSTSAKDRSTSAKDRSTSAKDRSTSAKVKATKETYSWFVPSIIMLIFIILAFILASLFHNRHTSNAKKKQ